MRIFSRIALATSGALLLTATAVPMAQALEDSTSSGDGTSQDANHQAEVKANQELEKHNASKAKLEAETRAKLAVATREAKKTSCEKRQQFIVKSMDRLSARSTKQAELLDKVTLRLQAYVTNKKLTVKDYDTLLSDVAAKKAAVQTNLEALQAAKTAFKCDSDNPRAAAEAYQTALRNTNKAIKDYRDSVKKLLVAIKQSQNDTDNSAKKTDVKKTEGAQ